MHDDDVLNQAAIWQARLSSDQLTTEQQSKFDIWLNHSEAHLYAWQEINTFWSQLECLSDVDISFIDDFADVIPLPIDNIETPSIQPIHTQIKKTAFLTGRNFSRSLLGMAASMLLMFSVFYTHIPQYFADYHTAPGELRTLVLSDGSQIMLNSDTTLSVDFTQAQRNINLHQGEAYFAVAADNTRPFVVKTTAGQVRALGTEFDIKNRDERVLVTVFEHAVSVSLNTGEVMSHLPQGQQLGFTESSFSKPGAANLARTQSWRKQRIIFQDKPLAEVVAELSHYRAGSIIILDSKTKALSVTGVFDTKDTNIALATIEQTLPVTMTKITEKLVFISAQ